MHITFSISQYSRHIKKCNTMHNNHITMYKYKMYSSFTLQVPVKLTYVLKLWELTFGPKNKP